jgi:hypothetical protein
MKLASHNVDSRCTQSGCRSGRLLLLFLDTAQAQNVSSAWQFHPPCQQGNTQCHTQHMHMLMTYALYMPDQQGRTPSSNTSNHNSNTHTLTRNVQAQQAPACTLQLYALKSEPTEACSSSNNNSNMLIAVPCSIAAAWRGK